MIKTDKLTKKFGDFCALEDISLCIGDSLVYGLLGCNGAGKSTLLSLIAGLYRPSSGSVRATASSGIEFDCFDCESLKHELFYVTDDPYFPQSATSEDMLRYFRGYYPNYSENTFKKLIKLFGIDEKKRISGFSKGMKRQTALICAFASRAKYLLLDESFDGLDPDMRQFVRSLLGEYMLEIGATVIVSSHNLFELESCCDTLGLINGKKLVFSSSIEDMRNKVRKYTVTLPTDFDKRLLGGFRSNILMQFGRSVTFVSDIDREELQAVLGSVAEITVNPVSLEEIFNFETEGNSREVEGIFLQQ